MLQILVSMGKKQNKNVKVKKNTVSENANCVHADDIP